MEDDKVSPIGSSWDDVVHEIFTNEKAIRDYIRNQLEEDFMKDQISIKEYMDPFTGEKIK